MVNSTNNSSQNVTFRLNSPSIYDVYNVELIILVSVSFIVNAFGVFANGVIFLATIRYPPLRRSSSCILMAHCILIDFTMSLYLGPTQSLTTWFGRYDWPTWFCPTWAIAMESSWFATNWAHAILAVNRFVATVLPHQYKWCTDKVILRCGVAFPWLMVVIINGCVLAGVEGLLYRQSRPWGGCFFYPSTTAPSAAAAAMALSTLAIYGPCALDGACYVVVLIKSGWSLRGRKKVPGRPSALEKRYEVAKVLFVCFLYSCVANYGAVFGVTIVPWLIGPKTILALKGALYVSSSLNPIIFLVISKDYRAGSLAVLQGRLWRTSVGAGTGNNQMFSHTSDTQRTSGKPINSIQADSF